MSLKQAQNQQTAEMSTIEHSSRYSLHLIHQVSLRAPVINGTCYIGPPSSIMLYNYVVLSTSLTQKITLVTKYIYVCDHIPLSLKLGYKYLKYSIIALQGHSDYIMMGLLWMGCSIWVAYVHCKL